MIQDERTGAARDGDERARRTRWILALLVIPGLALRFAWLEWMEFGGDEFAILCESYRASHESFALHGIPASIGIRLPPGLLYLLSVPMMWTLDPVGIAAFVALVNVLGLGLFFLCVRRALGSNAAWLALALLASAPWPVVFARKIWNPDLLFPAAAALYAALASLLAAPRPWKTAAALLSYATLCQFHASAWMLALPLAAWGLAFRVPFGRRGLLIGLALALLLWSPYVAYLVSTAGDDVRYAWHLRGEERAQAASSWVLLGQHAVRAVQTCSGLGFEKELGWSAGGTGGRLVQAVAVTAAWAFFLWCALATVWACGRALQSWARALRGKRLEPGAALGALFAAILVTILVVYAAAGFRARAHYHALVIPIPLYFAVELALHAFARRRVLLPIAAAAVVAGNALLLTGFFAGVRAGGLPTAVDYASPYAPLAEYWETRFAALVEEVESDHALERAEEAAERELFESAPDVLVRFDPARNEPPAIPQGETELEPGTTGLIVRGSTAVDMVRLPSFENDAEARIVLRLELEMPKDGHVLLFYETHRSQGYRREQTLTVFAERGRNEFYVELPAPDARGRVMLRAAAWRFLVYGFEVRRAPL